MDGLYLDENRQRFKFGEDRKKFVPGWKPEHHSDVNNRDDRRCRLTPCGVPAIWVGRMATSRLVLPLAVFAHLKNLNDRGLELNQPIPD